MSPVSYDLDVYADVTLVFASISTVCTLLTLFLLWDIGRWTGFAGLVCALTVSQLIYDIGFFVKPAASTGSDANAIAFSFYVLQMSGGLGTTLLTNVISAVVLLIAVRMRSYNVKANFYSICIFVALLSALPALMAGLGAAGFFGPSSMTIFNALVFYYYAIARVLSILFNFACYIVLAVKLRRMGWSFNLQDAAKNGVAVHPVCALSSRMIYYPVVQVLTRLPAAWLEFAYDMQMGDDDAAWVQITNTPGYKVANGLYSVTGPSAGIGFLIIFLIMQPTAFRFFVARLLCQDPHQGKCEGLGGNAVVSEGGTVQYAPMPTSSALANPLLSPTGSLDHHRRSPHHPHSQYREVLPSINDETLRNTSSDRSSDQSDRDRDKPGSFASRSSHYLESYNYAELDDDQLAALVDRFDEAEWRASQQSPSVLAGLSSSSIAADHWAGSGGGSQVRSRSTAQI